MIKWLYKLLCRHPYEYISFEGESHETVIHPSDSDVYGPDGYPVTTMQEMDKWTGEFRCHKCGKSWEEVRYVDRRH